MPAGQHTLKGITKYLVYHNIYSNSNNIRARPFQEQIGDFTKKALWDFQNKQSCISHSIRLLS